MPNECRHAAVTPQSRLQGNVRAYSGGREMTDIPNLQSDTRDTTAREQLPDAFYL